MLRRSELLVLPFLALAGEAHAQLTPLWERVNGNDIKNTNTGRVGIGVVPLAPLHVDGNILLQNGHFLFEADNQTLRFPPTSAGNKPMIELFASGTLNADRMVLAHSPNYEDWGLQYRDVSDEFHFLASGATLLNVDLGSFGVDIHGLLTLANEVAFSSVNDSLTFPAVGGASAPMIQMFASGSSNADRMVLAHSATYPTWGLQYRDVGDEFHFVAGGTTLLNVDFGSDLIDVHGDMKFNADTESITFPPSSGSNDAMIYMFESGATNTNRMLAAHSPAFPDWGLEYGDSADEFRFLGNGSSALTIELGSREVGIRTDSPAAALQVGIAGDGSFALANAWNVFSSRDYKKNIQKLSDEECADALEKVVATPVFRFQYKDQADDAAPRLGLIVEESPQEVLASEIQVDGATKALDLARYVSMLHAALKAQQAQITALQAERGGR